MKRHECQPTDSRVPLPPPPRPRSPCPACPVAGARPGGRPGANETVRIGVIGCGGRARTLVNEAKGVKGFRVAAACDCFRPRLIPT